MERLINLAKVIEQAAKNAENRIQISTTSYQFSVGNVRYVSPPLYFSLLHFYSPRVNLLLMLSQGTYMEHDSTHVNDGTQWKETSVI